MNLSVIEETLSTGILAVNLYPFDGASGVKFVDIYADSGKKIKLGTLS